MKDQDSPDESAQRDILARAYAIRTCNVCELGPNTIYLTPLHGSASRLNNLGRVLSYQTLYILVTQNASLATNSEDPDEMLQPSEKEIQFYLEL